MKLLKLFCVFGFHFWNGCKCSKCGKNRDEEHDWINCKCTICSAVVHDMSTCNCRKFRIRVGTHGYELLIPVDILLKKWSSYRNEFDQALISADNNAAEVPLPSECVDKINRDYFFFNHHDVPFLIKCGQCQKLYPDKSLSDELQYGKHGGCHYKYFCPKGHLLIDVDARWGPASNI